MALSRYNSRVRDYVDQCIRHRSRTYESDVCPPAALKDRIRELRSRAVVSGDDDFTEITMQLRSAIREHTERLRRMVVEERRDKKERRFRTNG